MKLRTKKIFCHSCQKLVRGSEKKSNANIQISCSKCGKQLWAREGIIWRYTGQA